MACDAPALLVSGRGYGCLTPHQRDLIRLHLLCMASSALTGNPCDAIGLLEESACYGCLTPLQARTLKLGLLCQIAEGGVTPPIPPVDCESADTVLPHDELLEGFQPDNFENVWTFEPGDGVLNATVGYDTGLLSNGKPTGACDSGIRFEVLDGVAGVEYYSWDRGSSIPDTDEADIYLYFYPEVAPDSDGQNFGALSLGATSDPSGNVVALLNIRNDSGQFAIRVEGLTDSAIVQVPVGQWYKIQIHLDPVAALSFLSVEDGAPQFFTRTNKSLQFIDIGVTGGKSIGESATYVMDLITLNTP